MHAPRAHDPAAVFGVLREAFPSCFVFCVGRGDATFVAASPELLVRREGQRVEHARARRLDPAQRRPGGRRAPRRAAAARDKDREEHAIVARRIERDAAPARGLGRPPRPSPTLVRVANIQHLGDADPRAAGRADATRSSSPGCCTRRRPSAASRWRGAAPLIPALEGLDRGWYAGPVGWTDATGDGEFCVALRCALLRGARRALLRRRRHRARLRSRRRSWPRPRSSCRRCCRCWRAERRGYAPAQRRAAHGAPRRGGAAPRSRARSVRTSTIVERVAARARARAPRDSSAHVAGALVLAGRRAPRRCAKSRPVGVATCSLERVACSRARPGRKSKIPPPSLSSSTIVSFRPSRVRREQAADVVRERDVADQQHDRAGRRAAAAPNARGDGAVDAVRAAVAQHARRVRRAPARTSRCRAPASRRRRTASRCAGSSTPSSARHRGLADSSLAPSAPRIASAARSSALRQRAEPVGVRGGARRRRSASARERASRGRARASRASTDAGSCHAPSGSSATCAHVVEPREPRRAAASTSADRRRAATRSGR